MFGINRKIDKAITAYEQGDFAKSLSLCKQILSVDSENSSVLITAGNIFYVQNNYDSAIKLYARVLQKNPSHYSALINIANSFYELKNFDKAIFYAEQALSQNAQNKLPYQILGNAYLGKEDYAKAIDNLTKSLEQDSSDPWIYNSLSQAYQKTGDYIASLSNAWKAVEKSPAGDDSHHINIGYLFYEIALEKGVDVIVDCVDLWYKKYGRNPVVAYMANSLFGNTQIKSADKRYVQNIFDAFASDFDTVLRSLDYQVPSLINHYLESIYSTSRERKLRILDLGCGTGLCGEFLCNFALPRGLEGIDLSSKMLEVANSKQLYSKLIKSDINSYLELNNTKDFHTYDLIVASDVLTYMGALEEVFENINKSLSPEGRIIFSISENTENKNSYFLHMSGRFLHSLSYIKNVLKNTCFTIDFCERHKLRNEGDKAVMGYIISARKID